MKSKSRLALQETFREASREASRDLCKVAKQVATLQETFREASRDLQVSRQLAHWFQPPRRDDNPDPAKAPIPERGLVPAVRIVDPAVSEPASLVRIDGGDV